MPMEISINVIDNRNKYYERLIADLDDIVYLVDETETIATPSRSHQIHDYLHDRFSNTPAVNLGYYPRLMGTVIEVIKLVEEDIAHVNNGGVLSDRFETIYIDRNTNYNVLIPELEVFLTTLNEVKDKGYKQVLLSWW